MQLLSTFVTHINEYTHAAWPRRTRRSRDGIVFPSGTGALGLIAALHCTMAARKGTL